MRKFFGIGLVLFVVVVGALISAQILTSGGDDPTATDPTTTAAPESTPATSLPPPSTGGEQDSGTQSGVAERSRKAAVRSAAAANEQVSIAQFLPMSQLRLVLKQTVVPELHARYEQQYPQAGKQMALMWGWGSTEQALANSQYRVTAEQCRVDRYTGKRAIVMLYTSSHWLVKVPARDDGTTRVVPFDTPLISAVTMRWEQGRWLFAGSRDVPAGPLPEGEQPVLESNLSYDKAVRRFEPYLQKGYEPCGA